jgi:hypothetical protein
MRERERKESGGVVRDTTFNRGNRDKYIYGYEGSQAVLARPSGRLKRI